MLFTWNITVGKEDGMRILSKEGEESQAQCKPRLHRFLVCTYDRQQLDVNGLQGFEVVPRPFQSNSHVLRDSGKQVPNLLVINQLAHIVLRVLYVTKYVHSPPSATPTNTSPLPLSFLQKVTYHHPVDRSPRPGTRSWNTRLKRKLHRILEYMHLSFSCTSRNFQKFTKFLCYQGTLLEISKFLPNLPKHVTGILFSQSFIKLRYSLILNQSNFH